jgi:hypothetical protein
VGDFAPEIVLDVNIGLLYSGRQKTPKYERNEQKEDQQEEAK